MAAITTKTIFTAYRPLSVLADHFPLTGDSYCTVRNIRYNKDNELLQKYKPLHDYSFFVYDVEKRVASGDSLANAIRSATDYCINHNIMHDYLSANYEEVFEMMSLKWNEKDAKKYWQKEAREEGHAVGLAQGISQGIVQGRTQGMLSTLSDLVKDGILTIAVAAKKAGMTEEAFRKAAML